MLFITMMLIIIVILMVILIIYMRYILANIIVMANKKQGYIRDIKDNSDTKKDELINMIRVAEENKHK